METFADYILSERRFDKKLAIMYFLQKKSDIYFNKSVVIKATLAKLFMEHENIDVDRNLVVTACLLCACKKNDHPQNWDRIKTYAKQSADYLEQLGFSKRFCKICEEQNRYSGSQPREKESDILEVVDQFGEMVIDKPERMGFTVDEAICLLENRNLKDTNNQYLEQFVHFINRMEEIKI